MVLGDRWSSREPVFWSSTVVSGSGFLEVRVSWKSIISGKWNSPFLSRLRLLSNDGRLRVIHTQVVQYSHDLLVEESSSPPGKRYGIVVLCQRDLDRPERFCDECLHSLVLVDDESKCRELA